MNNNSKMILGLIGAAAAGVLIGMMLAPEKGTDFRRRIGDTAGDWANHLTDLFANAKGELQNLTSKGEKAASQAADRLNTMKESYS